MIQTLNVDDVSSSLLYSPLISSSFPVNPTNSNRLYFQFNSYFESIQRGENYRNIPDIIGFKISKNLTLEGSALNYSLDKTSGQLTRVGVQYSFGTNDTLSWVSTVKKSNYNSLKKYNINNIALDISNGLNTKIVFLELVVVLSFYKMNDFLKQERGQINLIFMNLLTPVKVFHLGFGLGLVQICFPSFFNPERFLLMGKYISIWFNRFNWCKCLDARAFI